MSLNKQDEHLEIARRQIERAKAQVDESLALQKLAIERAKSVARIAIPGILLCFGLGERRQRRLRHRRGCQCICILRAIRHRYRAIQADIPQARIAPRMFQELELIREALAPTKYGAALWAIGYLIVVAGGCWWSNFRLQGLLDRIRMEDDALWQEFGRPGNASDFGRLGSWRTFRRMRVDQAFAERFNPHVVLDIRKMQQHMTAGLVSMALLGGFVVFLVWPHR